MEEAGFISAELWAKVVIPTMLGGTRVLGISSMPDTSSPFLKELMDTLDDGGKPVLNTINMKMVCERCIQRKREMQCSHMLATRPAHQDPKRYRNVRALLSAGDRRDVFRTEVMGMPTDELAQPAFESTKLALLRGSPDWEYVPDERVTIENLYVSIDPAAGGACSDYAITTSFMVGHVMILCGADTIQSRENMTAADLMMAHVNEVRLRVPGAANARAVIIVECNLGTEARWLEYWVKQYPRFYSNCTFMNEDNGEMIGFRSTNSTKHLMVQSFISRLQTRVRGERTYGAAVARAEPGVLRMRGFVTTGAGHGLDGNGMFEKVMTQFTNFMRYTSKARPDEAGRHAVFTYNGKGGRGKDDLAMAFLFASTMIVRFLTSDKYASIRAV